MAIVITCSDPIPLAVVEFSSLSHPPFFFQEKILCTAFYDKTAELKIAAVAVTRRQAFQAFFLAQG